MNSPAFDDYFSRLPKRQRAAWEQTRLAAVSAGKTDSEARVAAWRSIGVATVPNGGVPIPVTALLLGQRERSDYSPDQPRDPDGRWGESGGSAAAPKYKNTQARYQDPETKAYAPERQKLHDAYTESVTAGRPTTSTPTVFLTGGGPASGKTSAILRNPRAAFPGEKAASYIDPDGAKKFLPEFRAMTTAGDLGAAEYAHEESSDMAKSAIGTALAAGHDVVYDSVGDSGADKLAAKIQSMRDHGAKRIVAAYSTVDPAEAIRRSDARAEAPGPDHGRYVNHEFIAQAHADVSQTFQAAVSRGLFDQAQLWDNNGKAPSLVAEYSKETGLTVKDPAAWTRFQAIGSRPK